MAALVALSSLVAVANGATAACEGICDIPLTGEDGEGISCEAALERFYFDGDCCSLQEGFNVTETCSMVTTSVCYFEVKGDGPCNVGGSGQVNGEEVACVIPGTQWSALGVAEDEVCPESDFPVPVVGNSTDSEEITGTSAPTEAKDETGSGATFSWLSVYGFASLCSSFVSLFLL